jgi:hypothetical protein
MFELLHGLELAFLNRRRIVGEGIGELLYAVLESVLWRWMR